jgi:hypothetical protein
MLALAQLRSQQRQFEPLSHEDGTTLIGVDTISVASADEAPSVHTRVAGETAPVVPEPRPARRRAAAAVTNTTMPDGGGTPVMAQIEQTPPDPPAIKPAVRKPEVAPPDQESDQDLAPAPEPAAPTRAVFHVSAGVAQSLRVYDVYPSMPDAMRAAGIAAAVDVQICVANNGAVSGVTMSTEAAPALRDVLSSAIRTWRYRPLVLAGNATPFCHDMQLRYSVN